MIHCDLPRTASLSSPLHPSVDAARHGCREVILLPGPFAILTTINRWSNHGVGAWKRRDCQRQLSVRVEGHRNGSVEKGRNRDCETSPTPVSIFVVSVGDGAPGSGILRREFAPHPLVSRGFLWGSERTSWVSGRLPDRTNITPFVARSGQSSIHGYRAETESWRG